MANRLSDASPRAYARVTGVLYLLIIACGLFSEMWVRARLVVPGDAAKTASNIMASEWLFRVGFLGDSIVFLSDAAVAVLFYVLLKPASTALALIAAAFRLTQTAILGLNLLNHHAALLILGDAAYLSAFDVPQRQALALLFLTMHKHGYDLGLLFFGLHCLVLGYLMVRSVDFPTVLGALLIGAGLVYLTGSLTLFLAPQYVALVSPLYIVALVAELSLCFWLLLRGPREFARTSGAPVQG